MSICITKRTRYLHIPRCGGTWVTQALESSVPCLLWPRSIYHLNYDQAPGEGLFTWVTLRSPESWFRSYWVYRNARGWQDKMIDLDTKCWAVDFNTFIRKVLAWQPDWFDRFVASYTRPGVYVVALECLADGVVDVLNMNGEVFYEKLLRETPRLNASLESPPWDAELRVAIREANPMAAELHVKARQAGHRAAQGGHNVNDMEPVTDQREPVGAASGGAAEEGTPGQA